MTASAIRSAAALLLAAAANAAAAPARGEGVDGGTSVPRAGASGGPGAGAHLGHAGAVDQSEPGDLRNPRSAEQGAPRARGAGTAGEGTRESAGQGGPDAAGQGVPEPAAATAAEAKKPAPEGASSGAAAVSPVIANEGSGAPAKGTPAGRGDAAAKNGADAALAGVAAALPVPSRTAPGLVPLSEPVAPVPPGMPPWAFGASIMGGVADAFYSKVAVFASLRRGLGGAWAGELYGGRAFSSASPAFELCRSGAVCATPASARLTEAPGRLTWIGGASAVLRAAQGKVSLGGLDSAGFSLEASLGPAAVAYQVRGDDGRDRTSVGPGGRLSLGVAVEPTSSLAVRVDFTTFVYAADLRGWTAERQLLAGAAVEWRPGGRP